MKFITSDQHFGHFKVIGYSGRPYTTVEEMNQALIDNHNSVVGQNDEVIHLGDFTMNDKYAKGILDQLNGTHILIPGNHDKCHPCHKKKAKTKAEYMAYGFKDIIVEQTIEIDGLGLVKFNHLPYIDPGWDDARYSQFKPKPSGEKYLFHGHVHNSWKTKGNMINLGVDVWDYKPVALEYLIQYIKDNKI
jgi:calcineurin-like phosphoesterase family protein